MKNTFSSFSLKRQIGLDKKGAFLGQRKGEKKKKAKGRKEKREKLAWRGEVSFFSFFSFERECV